MKPVRVWFFFSILALASGCVRELAFNRAYLPEDEPQIVSTAGAVLVIAADDENFVYRGAPSSFQGWATELTMPLGQILKAVSETFLREHFSGGVTFMNEGEPQPAATIVFRPHIERFRYWYNALTNAGFAITPQVEVDVQVRISDGAGNELFDSVLESGRVSGDTYVFSTEGAEKVNRTLHRTLYDLLRQSLEEVRPSIVAQR